MIEFYAAVARKDQKGFSGEGWHLEEAVTREQALKALIATSALGMGYDKPGLGFVVHVGSPPSPV